MPEHLETRLLVPADAVKKEKVDRASAEKVKTAAGAKQPTTAS
jgi:hypothetical protein